MSTTTMSARVVLEPAAQQLADATASPPFLYELTPAAARQVLEDVPAVPIDRPPVDERWITVPADVGDVGDVADAATRASRVRYP